MLHLNLSSTSEINREKWNKELINFMILAIEKDVRKEFSQAHQPCGATQ